jgi:hypothetical protein
MTKNHLLVESLTSIICWIKENVTSGMCSVDKYILIRQLEDFRFVLKEVLDEKDAKLDDCGIIIRQLEKLKG